MQCFALLYKMAKGKEDGALQFAEAVPIKLVNDDGGFCAQALKNDK